MNQGALSISVVEGGDDAGNKVILDGLRAFNEAHLGRSARQVPVSVFVRDEKGNVMGGLIGQMLFEWLYIEKLWLPESLRGTGLGSDVMESAERYAVERGCRWAHLQTLEHQALPFYEQRGYTIYGVLDGYPPGSRRYHLRKTLVADQPSV